MMTKHQHHPNSLAEHLDDMLPPGQFDAPAQDDAPLIDAALLVASAPQPAPMSAEARLRIRAQVLNTPVPQQAPRVIHFPLQSVLRWAMIASLVLVLLTAGMSPAVLASTPGDMLYPIKQTVEQVEIALAAVPQNRAFVHLTHAERRAEEALTLLERGQLSTRLVAASLNEIAAAALLTQDEGTISTRTQAQLEARAVQVNTLLAAALTLAEQSDQIPQADLDDLATRIREAQADDESWRIKTPQVTAEPAITPIPTVAESPTAATVIEQTPEATAEADEIPTNIVLEGPVQAINNNIITIFDIAIQIEPDDPILAEIQIGDNLRIEGMIGESDGVFIIIAINVTMVEVEIIVPDAPAGQPPAPGLPSNCKQTPKGKIKCKRTRRG